MKCRRSKVDVLGFTPMFIANQKNRINSLFKLTVNDQGNFVTGRLSLEVCL